MINSDFYENKMYQINYDFGGYTKGIKVRVSMKNGVPISNFWRDRVKDSDIDMCMSEVGQENKTFKSKKKEA